MLELKKTKVKIMKKEELLNYTPKKAFQHGFECKKNGYSVHYNPYRNLTGVLACSLSNAWELGFNS